MTAPTPTQHERREASGWGWSLFRWTYARWRQIIAHADLNGKDQRPSQSKLAAFLVVNVGCICALWQVAHGQSVGASTVTVILAGLSASFGMKMYGMFLQRYQYTATDANTRSEQISRTTSDTRVHNIAETIERKIVEDADGDYEVTR
jgi:hypothetical protein